MAILRRIKKFLIAAAGISMLFAMRHYGVTIPGFDAVVLELIVSTLTAWGVYQARNEA